jgi:methylmalonic acid semialdehyde dehydrogenase
MSQPQSKKARTEQSTVCENFINGEWQKTSSGRYLDVSSPHDGKVIGSVGMSTSEDIDAAVAAAKAAFPAWSGLTVKKRAAIMFKFHSLLEQHYDEISQLITLENGKNLVEAMGDIAKGNETVEWACGLPQLCQGKILEVSGGITCQDNRDALGVVACVVPFNFPAMVPMWTSPIALTMGNCVILKPSEKVPLTMKRIVSLMVEAGIPKGVFQMVQGDVVAVNALCDHQDIAALTFVGSSKVAQIVAKRCRNVDKRVLALGGAKNHLIVLPDCHTEMASSDITVSMAGCAGQRCMAASALVLVGEDAKCQEVLDKVCQKSAALKPGQAAGQVGPVIDAVSQKRILDYIDQAEKLGSKILVDGRPWAKEQSEGFWVGPTVILHDSADQPSMTDEIFGPVISVVKVDTWDEAIAIENGNAFGNAASIYTSVGGHAEWFTKRFRAGMIGVNIGVPVPREPFSFGGMYGTVSKYGDMDITADGAMEFFSTRRKITTKWPPVNATVKPTEDKTDKANFSGTI